MDPDDNDPHLEVCNFTRFRKFNLIFVAGIAVKCGLLDGETGNEVLPLEFDGVRYLGAGRAAVLVGELPAPTTDFDSVLRFPAKREEQLGVVNSEFAPYSYGVDLPYEMVDRRRWALVELPSGKNLTNPVFDLIQPFREGFARARLGNKIGYIDTTGRWAVEARFDRADDFQDGLAGVQIGDRIVWIDRHGREVALFATIDEPTDAATNRDSPKSGTTIAGTAFFVSSTGDAITNAHVVRGCKRIEIDGADAAATKTVIDERMDLALLKFDKTPNSFLSLRLAGPSLGEQIAAYGYPLGGLTASSGVVTFGNVSALSGPNDRTDLFQFSAEIQPGSSGGPVIDNRGAVVGVVVARLSDAQVAKATGAVPQNVNFGVKSQNLATFLSVHGVEPKELRFWNLQRSQQEVGRIAATATVKVMCSR